MIGFRKDYFVRLSWQTRGDVTYQEHTLVIRAKNAYDCMTLALQQCDMKQQKDGHIWVVQDIRRL